MPLDALHAPIFWAGLALLVGVLVANAARTRNWVGLIKFWEKRLALTPLEFKIRNSAIALMIMGAVLRLLSQLL